MAEPTTTTVTRTTRPNVFGWKGVAAVLGVDQTTARRWADAAGLPVFLWGRRMIVAYEHELLAWAQRPRPTLVMRRAQLELPLHPAG
jgi:hypothetical protein